MMVWKVLKQPIWKPDASALNMKEGILTTRTDDAQNGYQSSSEEGADSDGGSDVARRGEKAYVLGNEQAGCDLEGALKKKMVKMAATS